MGGGSSAILGGDFFCADPVLDPGAISFWLSHRSHRMKTSPYLLAALVIVLAGCSTTPGGVSPQSRINPDDPASARREALREAKLGAREMYRNARQSLDSSDFLAAIETYDKLATRYPFSDYSTQGELERIYALYRNFEPDRTLSAADKFTREHPRHASIDYVQYIKGLTNYNRESSALNLLPIDESKADISSQRRAYDDFATLIQKFPNSRYAGDSYQRMVFLRNRLADHELHVVDFYLRRGAYVAAAKRAEQVIGQYPGTMASHRALAILRECYEKAGLPVQAADAKRLLDAQVPLSDAPTTAASLEPEKAVAEAPPEKPGVVARVVKALSIFDSSESGVEVVIPAAGADKTADAGPAATATTPDSNADVEPNKSSSKLSVVMEPYDDAGTVAPAPPAAPAEAATP
ncbi:MAG: outer membrane protein assembly factor BamD [Panacagrimonas sp.]